MACTERYLFDLHDTKSTSDESRKCEREHIRDGSERSCASFTRKNQTELATLQSVPDGSRICLSAGGAQRITCQLPQTVQYPRVRNKFNGITKNATTGEVELGCMKLI